MLCMRETYNHHSFYSNKLSTEIANEVIAIIKKHDLLILIARKLIARLIYKLNCFLLTFYKAIYYFVSIYQFK